MNSCMAVKNRLTVLIDGKEYTIVSEQPKEHIQAVALCVDTKMREVRALDSSKSHSTAMIAVLTTLNLAEDYINMKGELDKLLQRAEKDNSQALEVRRKLSEAENYIRNQEKELATLKQEVVRLQTILKTKGISGDE